VCWAGWGGRRPVSAGCGQGVQPGDGGDCESGPGVVPGDVQPGLAGGAGEGRGDGEESVPEPFGFPPAGIVACQRQHLHPGGQLDSHGDDGAPDLVLVEVVQGEVVQAGVFADPDPVFAAGSSAVA